MGEGVFVVNGKGGLLFMNKEAEKLLGWSFEEIKGKNIHNIIHTHVDSEKNQCLVMRSYLDNISEHSDDEIFQRKNGEIFPVSITASPIQTLEHHGGAVVVFKDITHRKELEKKLKALALKDALTGLYNRGSFDTKLKDEFNRSKRYGRELSLLMLDIDFFKKVNDTYGHQAGDEALKAIADIISSTVRLTDYSARYGGEEFLVILPETGREKAVEVAERIRLYIEEKEINVLEDKTIHLTVSIGVSTSSNCNSEEKLLKDVDSALYKAKEGGRNKVVG